MVTSRTTRTCLGEAGILLVVSSDAAPRPGIILASVKSEDFPKDHKHLSDQGHGLESVHITILVL